ncbi:collagen alpha-1(I) chain-like [Elgaria multicarinata webbii]|uniref:collagen alpha-1(I) chain-like n=1 Tax=Elgaria multicarinata webbii TaxID=159646 RepID=UPI002FCCC405
METRATFCLLLSSPRAKPAAQKAEADKVAGCSPPGSNLQQQPAPFQLPVTNLPHTDPSSSPPPCRALARDPPCCIGVARLEQSLALPVAQQVGAGSGGAVAQLSTCFGEEPAPGPLDCPAGTHPGGSRRRPGGLGERLAFQHQRSVDSDPSAAGPASLRRSLPAWRARAHRAAALDGPDAPAAGAALVPLVPLQASLHRAQRLRLPSYPGLKRQRRGAPVDASLRLGTAGAPRQECGRAGALADAPARRAGPRTPPARQAGRRSLPLLSAWVPGCSMQTEAALARLGEGEGAPCPAPATPPEPAQMAPRVTLLNPSRRPSRPGSPPNRLPRRRPSGPNYTLTTAAASSSSSPSSRFSTPDGWESQQQQQQQRHPCAHLLAADPKGGKEGGMGGPGLCGDRPRAHLCFPGQGGLPAATPGRRAACEGPGDAGQEGDIPPPKCYPSGQDRDGPEAELWGKRGRHPFPVGRLWEVGHAPQRSPRRTAARGACWLKQPLPRRPGQRKGGAGPGEASAGGRPPWPSAELGKPFSDAQGGRRAAQLPSRLPRKRRPGRLGLRRRAALRAPSEQPRRGTWQKGGRKGLALGTAWGAGGAPPSRPYPQSRTGKRRRRQQAGRAGQPSCSRRVRGQERGGHRSRRRSLLVSAATLLAGSPRGGFPRLQVGPAAAPSTSPRTSGAGRRGTGSLKTEGGELVGEPAAFNPGGTEKSKEAPRPNSPALPSDFHRRGLRAGAPLLPQPPGGSGSVGGVGCGAGWRPLCRAFMAGWLGRGAGLLRPAAPSPMVEVGQRDGGGGERVREGTTESWPRPSAGGAPFPAGCLSRARAGEAEPPSSFRACGGGGTWAAEGTGGGTDGPRAWSDCRRLLPSSRPGAARWLARLGAASVCRALLRAQPDATQTRMVGAGRQERGGPSRPSGSRRAAAREGAPRRSCGAGAPEMRIAPGGGRAGQSPEGFPGQRGFDAQHAPLAPTSRRDPSPCARASVLPPGSQGARQSKPSRANAPVGRPGAAAR